MTYKRWAMVAGGVVLVAVLGVAGATVPVTLSAPPDDAVVYVGSDDTFVPPHRVPLESAWRYEPMTYHEAIANGYTPSDPAEIRVTAPSAFQVLSYKLTGNTPHLIWTGTGEQPSYLD